MRYPNLKLMLEAMADQNDVFYPRGLHDDSPWPANVQVLENQAREIVQLGRPAMEAFSAGGETTELSNEYNFLDYIELHNFLDQVFDGDFTEAFCGE